MDPTVLGALIGAGGATIVAIAGFLANVKNTSETTAVSKHAVEVSQQAVEATKRTVELTEQGQVTDRYTKAIEQLGSDKLDVRIGGIYALERVASDSPRDHPTVMEVLAAFVRDHSHEQWPLAEPGAEPPEPTTRPDVQAAVTVIGRRSREHDRQQINLAGVKLPRSNLTGVDLTGANLDRTDLTGADLSDANLTEAILEDADLTGAQLRGADLAAADLTGAGLTGANLFHAALVGTDFIGADLTGTDLTGANLTRTDLNRAKLRNAIVTHANLNGTNLTRADLTGANLTGANLTDVLWPTDTPVPSGWQRDADSSRLKRAAGNSADAAAE